METHCTSVTLSLKGQLMLHDVLKSCFLYQWNLLLVCVSAILQSPGKLVKKILIIKSLSKTLESESLRGGEALILLRSSPSDSKVQAGLGTDGLNFLLGDTWVLGKVPKILRRCVKNWLLNIQYINTKEFL